MNNSKFATGGILYLFPRVLTFTDLEKKYTSLRVTGDRAN